MNAPVRRRGKPYRISTAETSHRLLVVGMEMLFTPRRLPGAYTREQPDGAAQHRHVHTYNVCCSMGMCVCVCVCVCVCARARARSSMTACVCTCVWELKDTTLSVLAGDFLDHG